MLSRLETANKRGLHRSVIYVTLSNPNVNSGECMTIDVQPNWMTPIKQFLIDKNCGVHSEKVMRQKVVRFLLIDQDIYRRGYTYPLLKCITPSKPLMSHGRYMRGYVVLIQDCTMGQWQPKYYRQAIIGRPYRVIVQNLCKNVLSARSMVVYLTENLRIFITLSPRGHL